MYTYQIPPFMRWPLGSCLLLLAIALARAHASALQLRGVPPALVPAYSAALTAGTFACPASNKIISASQLNDEFCDCDADGADEPGTSACKYAKFYCTNQGYRGQFVYSSHVNDGVCGMPEPA